MQGKSKEIKEFLKLINNIFGPNVLLPVDHWNDKDSIGLQKGNKLVYVSIYGKDDYYYECELLLDDPDCPYELKDSGNVNKEQLIDIITSFLL